MFRLIAVLIVVIGATENGRLDAAGPFKRASRSGGNMRLDSLRSLRAPMVRSQSQAFPDGFSFGGSGHADYGNPGYGYINPYAYDPYQYGSFEMQDPADDPYLRQRYRYDTFFPGRRGASASRAAR